MVYTEHHGKFIWYQHTSKYTQKLHTYTTTRPCYHIPSTYRDLCPSNLVLIWNIIHIWSIIPFSLSIWSSLIHLHNLYISVLSNISPLKYDILICLFLFSSADPKVSSAELMVLLICPSSVISRPSSSVVRPSTFALNRYSSYSSYSIILNFLLEKLGI